VRKSIPILSGIIFLILLGYIIGTSFLKPERVVFYENPSQTERGYSVIPASMPIGDANIPSIQSLNEAFVAISEAVSPAVVTIIVDKVVKNKGASPFHGMDDDWFWKFFGPMPEYRGKALGSGVIVDDKGYILTNNHVVDDAEKIKVKLMDDREYKAEVIGADPRSDVAVIKIDARDLRAAVLGTSESLRVGEWVLAIGSPLSEDLAHTVTAGIVSAKGRNNIVDSSYGQFIQTDAAINPGNSGGALVNIKGEVVGINTAIATDGGSGNIGIGFAIPIDLAKKVMKDLIEKGRVVRAWLGVTIGPIDDSFAKAMGIDTRNGALVSTIVKDNPADKAGLAVGDLIIRFDGQKVKDPSHLSSMVSNSEVGKVTSVVVLRDKKEKEFKIKLEEMPDDIENRPIRGSTESTSKLGIMVQDITADAARQYDINPDEKGVLVTNVDRNSEAANALRPGDVIKRIGYQDVKNVAEYRAALDKTDSEYVMFLVKRGNNTFFVTLELTK